MKKLASILAFSVLSMSLSANAYLSIAESGEILQSNEYQFGVEPQLLLNHGGGINANIFFDAPVNESTSARVSLGGGSVDFSSFASVKYVPFPDVDNQPAIGVRIGAGLARDDSKNILLAQFAPIVSKKFSSEYGPFVPYLAIPFELINTKEENFASSQVVFGTEYSHPEVDGARFGAEIGFETRRSYSYISAFVTIPFDSSKGLK